MNLTKAIIGGAVASGAATYLLMVVAVMIAISRPGFEFGGYNPQLFERQSMHLVLDWPTAIATDFGYHDIKPAENPDKESMLILGCNWLLFGLLGAGILWLLLRKDDSHRPFIAVFGGALANPLILFRLLETDWHLRAPEMQTLMQLNTELPGVLFNWSIRLLPGQIPFRYEMVIVLAMNFIAWSLLSWAVLRVFSGALSILKQIKPADVQNRRPSSR